MKKIISLVFCLVLICAGTAFATSADGTAITIPSGTATSAGGSITFNPSASTTITCATNATEFVIISGSAKNAQDVGMEYAVVSWSNAVYQRGLQSDKDVTGASLSNLANTFKDKSGASCPAS